LLPDRYLAANPNPAAEVIAAVWQECEAELRRSNAVDFDDLLVNGVRLLSEHPHVASVTRARENHDGDVLTACADAHRPEGVRPQETVRRLVSFGEGLLAVREEMQVGRSLGHVVLAAVMLDGGLVRHYERLRDTSSNAAARRDAERVLEDLRSLCRAAQAFEDQQRLSASLGDFLEHAAGLHAQELGAGEDRRVTVSTIHRSKGRRRRS
jgi:DNA helicase-2/ATP-dependent DNA helicase PcrA